MHRALVHLAAAGLTLASVALLASDDHFHTSHPLAVEAGAAHNLTLTPTADGCDDWPTSHLDRFLQLLNVDVQVLGWLCMSGAEEKAVSHPRSVAKAGSVLTPALCKAWCLEMRPPDDGYRRRAANASSVEQGWCCEWRAERGGQCRWSDGAPRLTGARCARTGPRREGSPCVRPLAFGLCSLADRFKRFEGGKCVEDRDTVIGRVSAVSVEQCSRRCDLHAQYALPGEPECKAFGYEAGGRARVRRHWYQHDPPPPVSCVLLDYCKVRPSKTYAFWARPEAIPPMPALT